MKEQGSWVGFDRYGEDTPLLNRLLDPDDKDPFIVNGTDGSEIPFEQLVTIPCEDTIYLVMRPLQYIEGDNGEEGIGEDECLIFKYMQDDKNEGLVLETDDERAMEIYNMYLELIEGANGED